MSNTSLIRSSTGRFTFALLLFLLTTLLWSTETTAQTVISKARIGGFSEDITYVSTGSLKNKIAILDGYEVFVVENAKKPIGQMTRLFDVRVPEIDTNPNGITYIASEALFAVNNVTHPKKLFLFDEKGAFKGTRDIQYLDSGYVPAHMEGLAYIPSSSPTFPDHLIMVLWDDVGLGPFRLAIARRDGVVVSEISRPDWPASIAEAGIGDVAYLAPGRLLVTTYDNSIWTMDFSGSILSGPLVVSGANGFEGIVQMSDERIVAVNYPQRLMFFDKNLNRVPESDRNDIVGLNLNTPSGIAWNTDTNQLLIAHDTALNLSAGIASVPTSLDSATPLVDLSSFPNSRQLSYLPGEHLIAVTHLVAPRAIVLFNSDGTLNSQIDLSPAALGQNFGQPVGITYVPTTDEFAVSFNGPPDPSQPVVRRNLYIFSSTGTLNRTLDLSCTGTAAINGLAYYVDPSGGGERFMILGTAGRTFITDLNGNSRNANGFQFFEFNGRVKLGSLARNDIAAITTGPLAGAFAVIDNRAGEVVIFRLD